MKKTMLTVLMALALAVSATAGDLFNKNELSVSLGSGYVVNTTAAFQQKYALNATAGAQYFATRNLGIEASLPFYSTKGAAVSEIQGGLLLRLPLSSTVPLFKNIAPYAGIGGVYSFETKSAAAYIGKAGVEFRINKGWSVFSEAQYRNDTFTKVGGGQVNLLGGIKLLF